MKEGGAKPAAVLDVVWKAIRTRITSKGYVKNTDITP